MTATKIFRSIRSSDSAALGLLAATHALVDGCCAALVFSLLHFYPLGRAEYWQLVVGYNLLAFALQPLCGMMVDRYITARTSAFVGLLLTLVAAVSFYFNPVGMVLAAGCGNAFFHIGGGVASMTMKNGHAGPPGIFVAPGAIGLAIGAAIGSRGIPSLIPMIILLSTAIGAVAVCRFRERSGSAGNVGGKINSREIIIALLLFSVALRSLVGFSVGGTWQGSRDVLLGFAIAAACGKAFGGVVADRVGWLKAGSIALVASSVFFIWGAGKAWCTVAGMLLLQATMPITLAALYRMLPQQPGLTFGLCCLALVAGAAPSFTSLKTVLLTQNVVMSVSLLSVIIFVAGLRMMMVNTGRNRAYGTFEHCKTI